MRNKKRVFEYGFSFLKTNFVLRKIRTCFFIIPIEIVVDLIIEDHIQIIPLLLLHHFIPATFKPSSRIALTLSLCIVSQYTRRIGSVPLKRINSQPPSSNLN